MKKIIAQLESISKTLEVRGATELAQQVVAAAKLLPTLNSMPDTTRSKAIDILQPCLAKVVVAQLQAKQAHWIVKGENFIALHELFDKVTSIASEVADSIAERIQQLGGLADASLLTLTTIDIPLVPVKFMPSKDMVRVLASCIGNVATSLRAALAQLSEVGDEVSSNLLQDATHQFDKQVWFLESNNQRAKVKS
jgi:starvation-inducible DNA-binding protein